MPPRAAPEDATSHDDLMMAIGQMRGEMTANFTTLFDQHRVMGGQLTGIDQRVARIEGGKAAEDKAAARQTRPLSRASWRTRAVAAAAIIAILGGLSAAYVQSLRIVAALAHALSPGAKP